MPFEPLQTDPNPHRGGANANLDPAQRSLADALRISFWMLKAAMAVVVAAYLFSGVFSVSEQEHVVRLRFGKIVGTDSGQVLGPGGPYLAMPYPIDRLIRVPASAQQIGLDREFWYELQGDGTVSKKGRAGPLDPERDGFLLTGDTNIVHARVTVTYVIDQPILFARNVRGNDQAK